MEWKLWNAVLLVLRWVDMDSWGLSLGFCTLSLLSSKLYFLVYFLFTIMKDVCVLDRHKACVLTSLAFKAGAKTGVVREGGGWHGCVCTRVLAGVGSSSFSVTFLQSPRLAPLRGTSGVPKLCQQSILSQLACQAWCSPLTPASCSPAARPVSGISDAVPLLLSCLAALLWDMALPCWPAAPCFPCASSPHCSPVQSPGSTLEGLSSVSSRTTKHQLEGRSRSLRSHLLPEEGYCQCQTWSAMVLLKLLLKISWP